MKYPYSEDRGELSVSLKPSESILIVYDYDTEGGTFQPVIAAGDIAICPLPAGR
jgi:hypothetical protein